MLCGERKSLWDWQAQSPLSGHSSVLVCTLLQCVPAIQLDQLSFLSAQCLSVTPVMVTALASLGWQGHTVTGVWWDTGASETMAADPVTVRGAATLSQETASAGECAWFLFSLVCLLDSFEDLIVIWEIAHAISGAKMSLHIPLSNFCQIEIQVVCSCKVLEMVQFILQNKSVLTIGP